MALKLITGPASEPVTLAEAKRQLRLEEAHDDDDINRRIISAREHLEDVVLWRALITQTWELTLDDFPDGDWEIRLPKGDVQSVTSVKYDDVNGAEATFANSNYIVDGYPPARIVLKRAAAWPETSGEVLAVRIRFVAGMATGAAGLPASLKEAALMLVAQMNEHRVPTVTGAVLSEVGFAVDALCSGYSLKSFA